MYSVGLNEICHVSGTFYEGRSAKFWYVGYENFWIYCKKIDINKYYSEFYEDQTSFLQFLQKKLPEKVIWQLISE